MTVFGTLDLRCIKCSKMSPPSKPTVVVTGFGLFGGYKTNASWEAVKELSNMDFGDKNVKLETKEISVEYKVIDKKIPHLFKKHNPILVVHVGLSGRAKAVTLEQCAHNTGYSKLDVADQCPKNYCCKQNGADVLKSKLNMQSIAECDEVKQAGLPVVVSQDAGRYCCDYIYYTSLSMQRCPVIFIHVPDLSDQFSSKNVANCLRAIISSILDNM